MALFTTMGMFIIDEIHFPEESQLEPQYNVIGGGGTYGALGGRVITTGDKASSVGWIVDKGSDFPVEVQEYLESWQTGCVWRNTPYRLTTRGWNMYGARGFRAFKYLTPKLRIDVDDLIDHRQLLYSQSYHLICSPERCQSILRKLTVARVDGTVPPPVITWEPVPDLCTPEHLNQCLQNLKHVTVLTPNAEEASRFFGEEEPSTKEALEQLASRFLPYLTSNSHFKTGSGIVLRCGPLGCYTLTTAGTSHWFPAFHNDRDQSHQRCVDPTGGGNAFIGALSTAFVLSHGDWEIASISGNLAAGIAIEQIGMPVIETSDNSSIETWNGLSIEERLRGYIEWNELDYDAEEVLKKLRIRA